MDLKYVRNFVQSFMNTHSLIHSIHNPFFYKPSTSPHTILHLKPPHHPNISVKRMAKPMFQEDFPMKIECEWDLILFNSILYSYTCWLAATWTLCKIHVFYVLACYLCLLIFSPTRFPILMYIQIQMKS